MITKKSMVLFLSISLVACGTTTIKPIGVVDSLRWLKQKFVRQPAARAVDMGEVAAVAPVPAEPVEHTRRDILVENNIPQFFEVLRDNPAYADLPTLIDQTITVNGKAMMPGTSSDITIEDGKCTITIKLHKGFAKLIYAMQQGALRGILMKLLKRIDPWIQWQYSVTFTINKDIDFLQLSDLVLAAYNKSLDQSAVNHRFKWILVVDLSLNETVEL